MKTRVYLDNCCWGRLFDDLDNEIVRHEAESVSDVQARIRAGRIELAWSFILDYEVAGNPEERKKRVVFSWKHFAVVNVGIDGEAFRLGGRIEQFGLRSMDALHIACAMMAKCDYFLTTDRKILNKRIDGITVLNPVNFMQEVRGEK